MATIRDTCGCGAEFFTQSSSPQFEHRRWTDAHEECRRAFAASFNRTSPNDSATEAGPPSSPNDSADRTADIPGGPAVSSSQEEPRCGNCGGTKDKPRMQSDDSYSTFPCPFPFHWREKEPA